MGHMGQQEPGVRPAASWDCQESRAAPALAPCHSIDWLEATAGRGRLPPEQHCRRASAACVLQARAAADLAAPPVTRLNQPLMCGPNAQQHTTSSP